MENLRDMLSAAKWGALIGVAIYLVSQFITFISVTALGAGPVDPSHPARITLGCLELLLIIFAFSASGYYAGRETRQAGYGALAGMITFAVYGGLLSLYTYGGRAALAGGTLGEQVLIELVSVTLYLLVAALIGWLGGRPGASQARARAARLAEQPTTPPQQQ